MRWTDGSRALLTRADHALLGAGLLLLAVAFAGSVARLWGDAPYERMGGPGSLLVVTGALLLLLLGLSGGLARRFRRGALLGTLLVALAVALARAGVRLPVLVEALVELSIPLCLVAFLWPVRAGRLAGFGACALWGSSTLAGLAYSRLDVPAASDAGQPLVHALGRLTQWGDAAGQAAFALAFLLVALTPWAAASTRRGAPAP